jgi:hypothetical protein
MKGLRSGLYQAGWERVGLLTTDTVVEPENHNVTHVTHPHIYLHLHSLHDTNACCGGERKVSACLYDKVLIINTRKCSISMPYCEVTLENFLTGLVTS